MTYWESVTANIIPSGSDTLEARVCWNDWSQLRPVTRWQVLIGCSVPGGAPVRPVTTQMISVSVRLTSAQSALACPYCWIMRCGLSGLRSNYEGESRIHVCAFAKPLVESRALGLFATFHNTYGRRVRVRSESEPRLAYLTFLLRPYQLKFFQQRCRRGWKARKHPYSSSAVIKGAVES